MPDLGAQAMTRTVAIIPARSDSRGVPRKNFRKFLSGASNDSLVRRTYDTAERAGLYCYVSTDHPDWFGGLIERPPELCQDDTPIKPVIRHAAGVLDLAPDDRIIMLYPVYPFRDEVDIRWIDHVTRGRDNACVGACEQREHPSLAVWADTLQPVAERSGHQRQARRECWRLTHWLAVYHVRDLGGMDDDLLMPAEAIRVPTEKTFDIDTWRDWEIAQEMVNE